MFWAVLSLLPEFYPTMLAFLHLKYLLQFGKILLSNLHQQVHPLRVVHFLNLQLQMP